MLNQMLTTARHAALSVVLGFIGWTGANPIFAAEVEVATKPAGPWKTYATRLLNDLPASVTSTTDAALDSFGGLKLDRAKATGFFRPEKKGDRWWLVDPEGGRFLHKAVVSVAPLRTPGAQAAFQRKFGTEEKWAAGTTAWLRALGFNGTGAWSDTAHLRTTPTPVVYTLIWNFMSSYGRRRGGTYQQPGHTGYPKDCIFVFDPAFEEFCDEHAQQLAATKDDPWLLGHFSDNELPLKREALANFLSLPDTDHGHRAALAWLQARHGATATAKEMTEKDRQDFLEYVVDRYLRIVARAIRRHDPNHLFLGSRFNGMNLRYPEIFRAAGRHLDVVAVNYYHAWSPDPELLAMWARESGRPILITEWYAKGMDAPGLANKSGAGWVVKTQADRGRFYENFTLGLIESRVCVGWHWFKYADNDPTDTKADPSNTDSNKGIVSNRYEPYAPLVTSMERINQRVYALAEYFDATPGPASAPSSKPASTPTRSSSP